jgi:threonine dehydratase
MRRSLASGKPERIEAVRTIADSLGAPFAAPYSFHLCQKYVDDLVLVSDDDLRRAMLRLYRGTKLAVEPAGAATTAALVGPLRQKLQGQRVALIVCGSNIDIPTFAREIAAIEGE